MVLLFLVASLQGTVPYSLFYRFYEEMSQDSDDSSLENSEEGSYSGFPGSSINLSHRQQIHRVIELLHSHYYFHAATNNLKNSERENQYLDRDDGTLDFEVCHFRLNKKDPFPSDMRVVWLSVNGFGVALVCYHYENRLLAEMILKLLTRHLNDFCRFTLQPSELFSKPEKVQIVLNKFLPYGQLLFMNHRLVRMLERETETAMKGVIN